MANPFMAAMGGGKGPQGPMNMMQAFQQFMSQNQGKDPNQMIQEMLSSGKIDQQQLNQAQQMAKNVGGALDGLKGMFGFK